MPRNFSPRELALLRLVQGDLPDSLTPYQDLASMTGMDEEEILRFLRALKDEGVIRRFGASLRHQKSGWNFNAMVAWKASPEDAEKWAPLAAAKRNISHVYYRPCGEPDWPWELYTMIHGKNSGDIQNIVDELLREWPLAEYAVLNTQKELKKISMTYFR